MPGKRPDQRHWQLAFLLLVAADFFFGAPIQRGLHWLVSTVVQGALAGWKFVLTLIKDTAPLALFYNRGEGFGRPGDPGYPTSDSRYEMRAIRDEVAKTHPSLSFIAAQIRSMKRLWEGMHEDGLLTRRDAEARLVEMAN